MCSTDSAGVRAATNQSETNAAATLEASSVTITSEIDQEAGGAPTSISPGCGALAWGGVDLVPRLPTDRGREGECEDDEEHDGRDVGESALVMPDGDVQVGAQARDHQDRHGQHEQDHDVAGAFGRKGLRAVLEAADDERQAQDEQHIGEDRADERRLDDPDQARTEGEDPEEQFRKVAERGLDDAGHPRAEAVPQPVDAAPDDRGEDAERCGGHDEREDGPRVGVMGDARGEREECACAEKRDVASGEIGSHDCRLGSEVRVVDSRIGVHSDPTVGRPEGRAMPLRDRRPGVLDRQSWCFWWQSSSGSHSGRGTSIWGAWPSRGSGPCP